MTDIPTVYLYEDEEAVRRSLTLLLRQRGLQVSAHTSGPELIAAVDAANKPLRGIFVLDERLRPMTGSKVHAQLLARGLEYRNPVLFLGGLGTVPVAIDAMRKGSITSFVKDATFEVIVHRILEALAQEVAWFARAARCQVLTEMWQRLPPQQKRIAPWIEAGTLSKVIAHKLNLSKSSVEHHRKKLRANLAVKSMPDLATLLAEMRACGIDTALSGPTDPANRAVRLPRA
jgi:two-component system response regulator DctR